MVAARQASWVAVTLVLVFGCRSATRTDLVEREMRHQEDQIYALQDYLAQYQVLVREYRSENETLREELSKGPSGEGPPSFEPSDDELPTPAPVEEPADVPPLELDSAGIPPLDATTVNKIETPTQRDERSEEPPSGSVTPVAFAEPRAAEGGDAAVDQVALRGEVWPRDGETGSRVLIEVAPRTADGQPVEFDGELSLMVLDPEAAGGPRSLARWDFKPDQWRPMVVDAADGTLVQLPLQLPPDVTPERPVQLWVRLVPDDGEKQLTHTALDLSRRGRFASRLQQQPVATRPAKAPADDTDSGEDRGTSVAVRNAGPANDAETPVQQSGWQIARPGERASLATSGGKVENTTDWQMATRPIPVVAEPRLRTTGPLATKHEPVKQAAPMPPPQWSPERPEGSTTAADDRQPPQDEVRDKVPTIDPPQWSPQRAGDP